MIRLLVSGSLSVALACVATEASAMGGGGNLSPSQSPYALLAPQTLGYPSTDARAASTTEEGFAAPGGLARSSRHPGRKATTRGWSSHGG